MELEVRLPIGTPIVIITVQFGWILHAYLCPAIHSRKSTDKNAIIINTIPLLQRYSKHCLLSCTKKNLKLRRRDAVIFRQPAAIIVQLLQYRLSCPC